MVKGVQQFPRDDEPPEDLNVKYIQGYLRIPEDSEIAEAQVAMLAEFLPEESW